MSFFVIYGALSLLVLAGTFLISCGLFKGGRPNREEVPLESMQCEKEELLDLEISQAELNLQDFRSDVIGGVVVSQALKTPCFRKFPLRWDALRESWIWALEAIKGRIARFLAILIGSKENAPSSTPPPAKELLGGRGTGGTICGKTYWPPRPLLSYRSFGSRHKEKVKVKY